MYKILDICIVYHFFYEKSINFISKFPMDKLANLMYYKM